MQRSRLSAIELPCHTDRRTPTHVIIRMTRYSYTCTHMRTMQLRHALAPQGCSRVITQYRTRPRQTRKSTQPAALTPRTTTAHVHWKHHTRAKSKPCSNTTHRQTHAPAAGGYANQKTSWTDTRKCSVRWGCAHSQSCAGAFGVQSLINNTRQHLTPSVQLIMRILHTL